MTAAIPIEHVQDAHQLQADAEIDLFEITPNDGSGTVFFKGDNDVTWKGQLYEGMPIAFTGLKKPTDGSAVAPKLTVGDGTIDLSPFKPLVYDGYLDGAKVKHIHLLLDNLLNNRDIKEERMYRVKRVGNYTRVSIELNLATASDALGYTFPLRQYFPPSFPTVSPS